MTENINETVTELVVALNTLAAKQGKQKLVFNATLTLEEIKKYIELVKRVEDSSWAAELDYPVSERLGESAQINQAKLAAAAELEEFLSNLLDEKLLGKTP